MNKYLAIAAFAAATVAAPAAAQQVNVEYYGTVDLSTGLGNMSPTLDLTASTDAADVTDGNDTITFDNAVATITNVPVMPGQTLTQDFGTLYGLLGPNDASISLYTDAGLTDLLATFGNFSSLGVSADGNTLSGNASILNGSQGFALNGDGANYYVGIQGGKGIFSATIAAVPEPSTWAMMLLGFGGMGLAMRRKRNRVLATA